MQAMSSFHPAVRTWFERRFPAGPTPPQRQGWPLIARGEDTLIAAPTGSGKTLSAFLVCIDRFYQRASGGTRTGAEPFRLVGSRDEAAPPPGVEVVYVSPLKALAADIEQNLQAPLAEIGAVARELGLRVPDLRVALRSGDTPASARAAMLRRPPQILVTTPESLFLLVTSARGRDMLRGVRTVIVDEIHAVARDKRGSHLALTLERLDALCAQRPARIGLSATQRPIDTIARLLVGAGPERSRADGSPRCHVVDEGHRRALDLRLVLPEEELEAVASGEQMGQVLDSIAREVASHRTTLVFVNTRRLAERIAHQLAERLGEEGVAAHHGSLSRDRRLRVETRLRAGELKALVATASLELGIDVGPVELVCQIGSPRSLATFLQRVGRSGHFLGGIPKGRLYPLTRDELVECAALLRGVRAGHLDAIQPPRAPLDILAQQVVAACASDAWREDELFACVRGAAPYADLRREDFDAVVAMLAEGIATGRGRRAAWLHRDRVNGVLRGRRGARLAALTSGGAIPEVADYRVVADPDETVVGSVGEDFAIESLPGDVFLLGSTSWRVRRVESGVLRVVDAQGAPPSVPFWVGEAPARSAELSAEVSQLRSGVQDRLRAGEQAAARAWLEAECGVGAEAARQIVVYLSVSLTALGGLPTADELVFERFFDESGGMQLVVHSPLGARLNRALCLALRKKFCRHFNFELQAAAGDDSMVLSLGPHHGFPLDSVPRFVTAATARDTLSQAVLTSPMFTTRWRWNLNRALVVLRQRAGRRNPPPIQRMEADDLMAAVFPSQAACQENVSFPIEIPDHPLVRQTLDDCLQEAMDVDGLVGLLADLESGRVRARCVDTTEPSPLSHEILNGRPFTFLDDAPLEERRTRAVKLRRGLPVEARELARLDPEAIARVREEAQVRPRDADELHDLLLTLGWMRAQPELAAGFARLVRARRAFELLPADAAGLRLWCAAERSAGALAVFPGARLEPATELPAALAGDVAPDAETATREAVRGHLDGLGPVSGRELAARLAIDPAAAEQALVALEAEGFALRGDFEPARGGARGEQFCSRRLLTRIHRHTQERLRREIEPVSAQDFMRFLLRWQHVAPGSRCEGPRALEAVVAQLQGFEIAAGAWEESILPARIDGYRSAWLDAACLSGEVGWARLALPQATTAATPSATTGAAPGAERAAAAPSRATPLCLLLRADLSWLLRAHRGESVPEEPTAGAAAEVLACLRSHGALFHADLASRLPRLPVEIEEGLWALVARGLVTADGFQAVRSLLGARERWARTRARARAGRGLRRGLREGVGAGAEGRWSLLPAAAPREADPDELAEALAEQLLARWGVVFRDLVARETLVLPWRELLWALRRLEARGVIRGGRFVSGFVGEQYALPEAVEGLRRVRKLERRGELVRLCAADPLNLVGIVVPGPRVPALRTREVVYRDGLPWAAGPAPATLPSSLRDSTSR